MKILVAFFVIFAVFTTAHGGSRSYMPPPSDSVPPPSPDPCESAVNDAKKNAGDKLVVVYISMNNCAPCNKIKPKVDELAKNGNVVVVKLQFESCPKYVLGLGVKAFPGFIFYKNGKEADRFSGADENRLNAIVNGK